MIDSVFLHELKQAKGVRILPNYILFKKPCELYNLETDESVKFKNVDEAFKYEIDGKTIKDIVKESTMDIFTTRLDGGSGSSGPSKQFKPSHATNKTPKRNSDLPARMNTRIKTKTVENAINEFRRKHGNDSKESMIMVDRNGFVTQYNHGGKHSVAFSDNFKDGLVIHNHPSNSHFSDTDVLNLSTTKTRGVVATTKSGYYMLEKGTHFNANSWAKAVRNAKFSGTDYNDGFDKWLRKNAKKHGLVYKNVKDDLSNLKPLKMKTRDYDITVTQTSTRHKKRTSRAASSIRATQIKFDTKTGQGSLF